MSGAVKRSVGADAEAAGGSPLTPARAVGPPTRFFDLVRIEAVYRNGRVVVIELPPRKLDPSSS